MGTTEAYGALKEMEMIARSLLVLSCTVLLVGVPATASAQSAAPLGGPDTFGVGLSFLGDEGGTGVTADVSLPLRTLAGGQILGWVGDVSFHRNSFDGFGANASLTSMMFQGGVRITGRANEKVTWHGQGLVGVMRASYSAGPSGANEELCDSFGLDCEFGGSDTDIIFTPGVGINYWFNERTAFRAQLDIPIGGGGSTTRVWIGISRSLGQ